MLFEHTRSTAVPGAGMTEVVSKQWRRTRDSEPPPHSCEHLQNNVGARCQGNPFPNFMKIHAQLSEILFTERIKHIHY